MKRLLSAVLLIFLCTAALAQTQPDWLQIKNAPFIDARKSGVKADGVTDDTVALQAAITAAAALDEGGTVLLPTGAIVISSTITIPNKVHIMGTGYGTIYYGQSVTNYADYGSVILWKGTQSVAESVFETNITRGLKLENFSIIANTQSKTGAIALDLDGSTFTELKSLVIAGFGVGISAQNQDHNYWTNIQINFCGTGAILDYGANHFRIYNFKAAAGNRGIDILSGTNISIYGGDLENNTEYCGKITASGNGDSPREINISGIYHEAATPPQSHWLLGVDEDGMESAETCFDITMTNIGRGGGNSASGSVMIGNAHRVTLNNLGGDQSGNVVYVGTNHRSVTVNQVKQYKTTGIFNNPTARSGITVGNLFSGGGITGKSLMGSIPQWQHPTDGGRSSFTYTQATFDSELCEKYVCAATYYYPQIVIPVVRQEEQIVIFSYSAAMVNPSDAGESGKIFLYTNASTTPIFSAALSTTELSDYTFRQTIPAAATTMTILFTFDNASFNATDDVTLYLRRLSLVSVNEASCDISEVPPLMENQAIYVTSGSATVTLPYQLGKGDYQVSVTPYFACGAVWVTKSTGSFVINTTSGSGFANVTVTTKGAIR